MGQKVLYALEIMGKGMGSIFVVIILITLIVLLMGKISRSGAKRRVRIILQSNRSYDISITEPGIIGIRYR